MKHWRFSKAERIPLYKQLEHAMIRDIRHGFYRKGDLLPSISEMDAELSLGRVTIVNAFCELVKDGYAIASHGRGHYVSERGDKVLVGLVLPVHSYYFLQMYAPLISGLQVAADRHCHRVVFRSSDEDPERFIQAVDELVLSVGCRWLAVVPPMQSRTGAVSKEAIRHLRRRRRKVDSLLVLDRDASAEFPQVRQDRAHGEGMLLERACAGGARKLAFLDGDAYASGRADRLVKAAARHQASIEFLVTENPESNLARIQAGGYDAVLCGNDVHARRLLNLTGGKPGFRVAGYDATAIATGFSPQITTVNSGLMEMGTMAFGLLSGQIRADSPILQVAPTLVPGETL
jgi:DNA-binding LacI/PurR family transcriptional regulator